MRIPVTFTESVLFQEATPLIPPASDVLPMNAPGFQNAYPNPIKAVDPRAVTSVIDASHDHVYPDCYVGFGKWEIHSVVITNANVEPIQWSLIKMPVGTFKLGHFFYQYSASGSYPQVEPRAMAILYSQPLNPIQTWFSPPLKIIVNAGESLWATSVPGYISPFATPNGPIVNVRITGDIIT